MNGFFKPAALSLTAIAMLLAPMAQVSAHDRWQHHKHRRHHQPVIVKKNDTGELIAAGIVGLAIGAIIVGAANSKHNRGHRVHQPVRPRPDRNYFPPSPENISDEPEIIYAEPVVESPEPWTREWFRYCQNRYRSFDDQSGTFLGYDGKRHFCVAR